MRTLAGLFSLGFVLLWAAPAQAHSELYADASLLVAYDGELLKTERGFVVDKWRSRLDEFDSQALDLSPLQAAVAKGLRLSITSPEAYRKAYGDFTTGVRDWSVALAAGETELNAPPEFDEKVFSPPFETVVLEIACIGSLLEIPAPFEAFAETCGDVYRIKALQMLFEQNFRFDSTREDIAQLFALLVSGGHLPDSDLSLFFAFSTAFDLPFAEYRSRFSRYRDSLRKGLIIELEDNTLNLEPVSAQRLADFFKPPEPKPLPQWSADQFIEKSALPPRLSGMDWEKVPADTPEEEDKDAIPRAAFVAIATLILLAGLALIIILTRK
ncbi:MAG: hypothetical protein U5N86_02070 [Planctomycetota bacterium]|nr:hypothetical protein [Planctomycetota bacterium]